MSEKQFRMNVIITQAQKDAEYKKKLIADPRKTLEESGIEMANHLTVRIHEDTSDTINLVIPRNPADAELSDEMLDAISAAGTIDTCYHTTCIIQCY